MPDSPRIRTETYQLFSTPVMTFEHPDDGLNAALARTLETDPFYNRKDQAQRADSLNLCDRADADPAIATLEALSLANLKAYCAKIGWMGDWEVELQMFANVAAAGHIVPSHNHVAHIAAVYYVATPDSDLPVLEALSHMERYWTPSPGALILHDPRFNASLMGGWQAHAHVHPRPGLMILFPAFVWHEVAPHFQEQTRLSIAINFTLTKRSAMPSQRITQIEVG